MEDDREWQGWGGPDDLLEGCIFVDADGCGFDWCRP